MLRIILASLTVMGLGVSSHATKDRFEATLYLFLSMESRGSPAAARRVVAFLKEQKGRVRLRPVVLLKDFRALGRLRKEDPFYQALKELQKLGKLDVPLYDEEGLKLAERWRIRSVPTFVLVHSGRAHVASGGAVNLDELLECER